MSRSKKPASNQTLQPEQNNSTVVAAQWQGPLPPPSALKAFDDVVEHGAERIFHMAEQEQAHRHAIENITMESDVKSQSRGQYFGFIISIISILGAAITGWLGVHWSVSVA
ncbi:MAG: DUF2335 domain-containing protein [Methylococcales bacterium]